MELRMDDEYKKKKKQGRDWSEPKVRLTKAQTKELDLMKKWEDTRAMGKMKYVLLKGTVAWTLLTGGIFVILTLITNKFLINTEILMYFLNMFLVFLGLGTLFGVLSWHLSEKKYQSYIKNKLESK